MIVLVSIHALMEDWRMLRIRAFQRGVSGAEMNRVSFGFGLALRRAGGWWLPVGWR